jgi:hypothetical protein
MPKVPASRRLLLCLTGLASAALALASYACGTDSDDDVAVGVEAGASGDDASSTFSEGGTCQTSADCNGGVCNEGVCCATAAAACGHGCCAADTVCVFDKCVTPGVACRTSSDCPSPQYCETALGGEAADASADGSCLFPLPPQGRCLDTTPVCDDAGAPSGCVPSCEYRRPAGPLSVTLKWEWGSGLAANEYPDHVDVWSTPAVGRVHDSNCDGKLDDLDPPSIVFVSGDSRVADAGTSQIGTCCQCTGKAESACQTGVLRAVDGATGRTLWSLARDPKSPPGIGFAGVSPALGDVDGDGRPDIVVATGDGYVSVVSGDGNVIMRSDLPIETTIAGSDAFGWGGGLAIADVDGDGAPEIAYGRTLYSTSGGALTRKWVGKAGLGGSNRNTALSTLAQVATDDAGTTALSLIAGRSTYRPDGGVVWTRNDLGPDGGVGDGFPAVADLNRDGSPELVVVTKGRVWILDPSTGAAIAGPFVLAVPTDDGGVDEDQLGAGGPPTIADFDGDGFPDIGVANSENYFVLKTLRKKGAITGIAKLWSQPNHDFSSSQTGSTVFDFEGDGKAEVVYADECFLWVWGFESGQAVVRLAIPTTSFTATEASLVADVDGDGHAEILVVANRADPSSKGWKCDVAPWNQSDSDAGRPAWTPPAGAAPGTPYRGLRLYGDKENGWVGTRTLWSQHTYHVTNVCDPRDSACASSAGYGSIPKAETPSWTLPWVNSFRQNVLDKGIFDAPDAVVSLHLDCTSPLTGRVAVRNEGRKGLPAGVRVGVFDTASNQQVAEVRTSAPLLAGQTANLAFNGGDPLREYVARVVIDPANRTFRECREDNDESAPARAACAR